MNLSNDAFQTKCCISTTCKNKVLTISFGKLNPYAFKQFFNLLLTGCAVLTLKLMKLTNQTSCKNKVF